LHQNLASLVETKLLDQKLGVHLNGLDWSWLVKVTQVVEALVLALATNDKVVGWVIGLIVAHCGDALGVPIFLLLIFFVFEFSSQTSTALLLLFFGILLLVFLHLELHHLHSPGAHWVVLHQVGVLGVDLGWVWSLDLVHVARLSCH